MPKKKQPNAQVQDIKQAFLQEHAPDLWDRHEDKFMQILEESENRKVSVTFNLTMDFSESTAQLNTRIRYSQVMTDERTADFDDPNQVPLPLEEDNEEEVKPSKRRK
jgi:hypothetical protein